MTALNPDAQPHHANAEKQKSRRDDIGQYPHVRIAVVSEEINRAEEEKRKETSDGYNPAGETQPVAPKPRL